MDLDPFYPHIILMHILHERIKLITHYSDNMSEMLQEDITQKCIEKIENLTTSYFKKFLKKEDAEITITAHIDKNSAEQYIGKFHFVMDNEKYDYHNDKPYEKVFDLISSAFRHVKEHLADMKE